MLILHFNMTIKQEYANVWSIRFSLREGQIKNSFFLKRAVVKQTFYFWPILSAPAKRKKRPSQFSTGKSPRGVIKKK
jgi:hypothetical protein